MGWKDPDPMPMALRYQITATATLLFFFSFGVLSKLLAKYSEKYRAMSNALQTDTASRINSTVHGLILTILLPYGLLVANRWNENWLPIAPGSVYPIHFCIAISAGYFISDGIILVLYKSQLWGVFVVHHFLCLCPICINVLFMPSCNYGMFSTCSALLMEYSLIHLNIQVFMQELGFAKEPWYVANLYWLTFTWIILRIVNPICCFHIALKQLQLVPQEVYWWMMPGIFALFMAILLSIVVFFTVICKEIRLRWERAPDPMDIASPTLQQKGIEPSKLGHMTKDEVDLTVRSPTRRFMHMAEEKVKTHQTNCGLAKKVLNRM